ncbi:uncharacterized protein PGRI_087280 [Penicillium griseofulvum]|uniref:Uncharacterized protein n=1 Tax=Penicillium patulum TaxID=5078 RepID=A0A135LTY3_PENPA|nr:uncharacterized protein PGRI_087280 [Penicillium griseofulvum]KXG52444.1 hypothetical protein PGRI_087280 [Penicillium griseofulvum]
MDALPPASRLTVVCSQVAIGSELHQAPIATPTNIPTDTEPFPEYDESQCELVASAYAAEKPLEDALIHALGKAAHQEIRTRDVDPKIIPYVKSDPSHRSQVILEQLLDLLSEPQMRREVREQFIIIVNATLQFNKVIFHQCPKFLSPQEIRDARRPLEMVLRKIQSMEYMLKDQLYNAEKASSDLKDIEVESLLPYERLRKMASVVAKNMEKPRFLEERLLSLYMDMYEEWIHVPFLCRRNIQLKEEKTPSFPRMRVSRRVITGWQGIGQCIDTYSALTRLTLEIKEKYLTPIMMGYLCDPSEIWEQCWDRYENIKKDQHKSGEEDLTECLPN